MDSTEFFPSRWLKVDDLGGQDRIVVIDRYSAETIRGQNGTDERRLVIWFRGISKGLILNATNCRAIEKIAGTTELDAWVGQRLLLTRELVAAFGKSDWAIRVKPAPQPAAPQPAPQAVQPLATVWGAADNEGAEPF